MSLVLHSMKTVITLNLNEERLIFVKITEKDIEVANSPKTYCCSIKEWKHVSFLSFDERLKDIGLDLDIKDIQYIRNLIDYNLVRK